MILIQIMCKDRKTYTQRPNFEKGIANFLSSYKALSPLASFSPMDLACKRLLQRTDISTDVKYYIECNLHMIFKLNVLFSRTVYTSVL